MENKKQTAIEWLFEQFNNQDIPFGSHLFKEAKELEKQKMIEFAKMHVQEALKQASEKAFVEYIDLNTDEIFDYTDVITDDDVGVNVNKESILKSYSLENIK